MAGYYDDDKDDDTWEMLGESYGIENDETAMAFLWDGWFEADLTSEEREEARELFFEYTGMDEYDFDWEDWREYMGYDD